MACAENHEFPDPEPLLERARRLEATGRRLLEQLNRSLCESERCLRRAESRSPSLANSIEGRLQSSPFLPLRKVTCEEHDGRVTLRGRVPTQYLQAFACSLVRSIDGVREISNQIEVVPLNPPPARAPSRDW
jgi:hypothetical protein